MPDSGEREFARLINCIEPWLSEVVIIGGWAYRLYSLTPQSQEPLHPLLMTLDADIAVPAGLGSGGDIRERLVQDGFEEVRGGDDTPPQTHYQLSGSSGFYAEFLSPLSGSEYDRGGKSKVTRRLGGVVSQQLRHLEIFLIAPWPLNLDEAKGFPVGTPKQIRIANPVSFFAHKLLIHDRRASAKVAKDVMYIYDTLQLFGAGLNSLNQDWNTQFKDKLHARHIRKIESGAERIFGSVNDVIREASRLHRGLSSEAIRESCFEGLKRVFH